MNNFRLLPSSRLGWLSFLWVMACICWTIAACLITHHARLRSEAALALTMRLSQQLQPLYAKQHAIQQEIDLLPGEKYRDGTPARKELNRLYEEMKPVSDQMLDLTTKHLVAQGVLNSGFWSNAQRLYNRSIWWLTPFLFGGWLLNMVSKVRARRPLVGAC